MTASAMQADRERCHQAGMSDFIAKPVLPKELGQDAGQMAGYLPAQSFLIMRSQMKLFNRHMMRNQKAASLLELFFVVSVLSVLGIRFFLALTGYPSL